MVTDTFGLIANYDMSTNPGGSMRDLSPSGNSGTYVGDAKVYHGTCSGTAGVGLCQCVCGWTGVNCTTPSSVLCVPVPG